MTEMTYQMPTEQQIRAIQARAHKMRAETTRAGFVAAWGWFRSLFTTPAVRTARAD